MEARLEWANASGETLALKQADQQMPTVAEYLRGWLATYAKVNCKLSTYEEYQRAIEGVLIPALGMKQIDTLKREHLKAIIATWIESGKSRSTVRNYLAPLKSAYFQAVEEGLVTVNPLLRISKLCKGTQSADKHMQPLTADEVEVLLGQTRDSKPRMFPLLLCAVRTGLRRGELIGLQWGDVAFHGKFLMVRRSVVRGRLGTPKSKKARRVDMSNQLGEVLRTLKEVRELEAMASNGRSLSPDAYVFLSPQGYRLEERNLETV